MTAYLDAYRGRRLLVTGGLGFIGSNLARRLVDLGAHVSIVDALIPDHGGNRFANSNALGFGVAVRDRCQRYRVGRIQRQIHRAFLAKHQALQE